MLKRLTYLCLDGVFITFPAIAEYMIHVEPVFSFVGCNQQKVIKTFDEPKINRVTGTLEFAEKTSAVVIMPLGDTLPEPLRTK
ncbi:MAG: hypothetical protein VX700_04520 [Pseudomonadota bacterium]|nr:hypothetical protein [Pseudomonadota bacterium]